MAAQAQDTIFVDEDDPNNADQISTGISAVDENGDVVVVRAGGYNESLTVTTSFDFTIEARTDDDSGADAVQIDRLEVDNGGNTITVRSDGTGFIELDGSGTLDLEVGTVSISSSRDFQFLGGATVVRRSGGSISGSAPSFAGNTNVTYDLQDGDITAGLEAPSNLGNNGTLTIEDVGGTGGNEVEFPSGRFGTFSANDLSINDDVSADFRGDLNVDQSFQVGSDQSLTVAGTLTLEDNNQSLTVDSDPSSPNNDAVNLGSLVLPTTSTAATAPLGGNGRLVVNGAVTFQAVSDAAGDTDRLVEEIDVGSSGDFEIGSIEETSVADGSATDFTVVDVLNDAGGTVTLAGGSFRQLDNSGVGSTFEVTGDVTTDVTGGNPILNGTDGATINISSGNTLTAVNDDGSRGSGSGVIHTNSNNGGITGNGTLRLESGAGGESHTVNVSGPASNDVNRFPSVEVAGGNGATFNGSNTDPEGNAIQIGGSLTADAPVTLSTTDGGARIGGALTVNTATTDLTGVTDAVSTADVVLNGSGTLNTNNNRLEIRRDFARNNSNATLATTSTSTIAFTAGGTNGTFDTETLFTINGTVRVNKPDATITLEEAVRVNGDFEIVDQGQFLSTTLRLEDNLFLQGGGQLTIDSNLDATADDNFVVFESAYTVAGDDTLDNAIVEGGSNVTIDPSASTNTNTTSLKFDGLLSLRNGGVTIVSNADLSPADESGAEVVRTLDGGAVGGQEIDASASGATFNGDGVGYALTYRGGASDPTEDELTDAVADLTVQAGTTPLLARDVEVNGSLTVAETGQIDDNSANGGGDQTIELTGDGENHTINGQVEGDGSEVITLAVSGQNATINGGSGTGTNDSVVESVLVTGTGTTVSGIQQIRGTLDLDDGGLQLGLRAVNTGDQVVDGDVTVSDSLSLASDVEFASGSSSDAVKVESSGRINVGNNELAITGSGADFDGDSGARYYSSGEDGIILFDGGGTPTFATEGEAIPRLQVDQSIQLSQDAATDVLLDANADIDLNGNAFDFSGRTELAADVTGTSGGSVFRARGTTLRIEGSTRLVSNFEVDSDTSTVNLTNDVSGAGSAFSNFLQVTNQFTMDSGTLDYAANMVLTGSLSSGNNEDEFVYNGGDFQLTKGYIVLRSGGTSSPPNTVASFDIEQDSTLSIPNLGIRDDAELSDEQNLVVTNDLRLVDNFSTSSQGGRLVIADGATIDRRAPSSGVVGDTNPDNDILDESPAFQSSTATYNLEYVGSGQAITSGHELVADQSRIQNLTINRSGSDVYFESNSNVVTGDVTVNGSLNLFAGALDYGRQVVVADSATVVRSGGRLFDVDDSNTPDGDGGFADGGTGGNPAPIEAPGFYTLVYDGNSRILASEREFLSDGDVALETRVGVGPPVGPSNGSVDIPFDRTVRTFAVSNGTSNSVTFIGNRFTSPTTFSTLTVTDSVSVSGGQLNGGTVIDQGGLTVVGGSVNNTFDVEGDTRVDDGSFNGSLTTAGDVEISQDGNFSAGTLEFDGDVQDLTLNGGAAPVTTLAMSQQNGENSRVILTGNELVVNGNIDFNSGLVVVPDSANQGPGTPVLVELSNANTGNTPGPSIPFNRSDVGNDSTDASHIVGPVRVGVTAGTPGSFGSATQRGRFEFPVGTMEEYRPAAITFRTSDPIEVNTNIVIDQVGKSPGGTEGLPIDAGTDDQGNPVTIGQYPSLHWNVVASTGLGPSQQFDLELETGTETFIEEFEDASQLRIIRRFAGDANENKWRLQAGDAQDPGNEYDNALIRRNQGQFANVQSQTSTGGISSTGALFTIGVPTDVAQRVDVAIEGGGSGGLNRSFSAQPGDSDAPVGIFRLSPSGSGVVLDSAEVQTNGVATSGVQRMSLWASSDASFSTSDDTRLDSVSVGGAAAPDSVVFDNLADSLGSEQYVFVTTTLDSTAGGEVSPQIASEGDLKLDNGQIAEVNGNTQSSFSSLSLSSGASTLPVELANFDAKRGDGEIRLTWSTASETNNAEFRVQRKVKDGSGSWKTIGRRDGAGTTTEGRTYRFTDANLPFEADELVYRLRQVDLDGSAEIAGTVTVTRTGPKTVKLLGTAPNPARTQATVRYAVPEEAAQGSDVRLELFDVMGRKVRSYSVSGKSGRHKQTMSVSDLSSGIYFLRLRAGNTTKTRKLTVVR